MGSFKQEFTITNWLKTLLASTGTKVGRLHGCVECLTTANAVESCNCIQEAVISISVVIFIVGKD